MDTIKHYRRLLGMAKSWAIKNIPSWTEEAHQDLLQAHGCVYSRDLSRYSATTMTQGQLQQALFDYERRGWQRLRKGQQYSTKPSPQIDHIVRLWGLLGRGGHVRDSSRKALLAWVARQHGQPVKRLDDLSANEQQRLVEALKQWLAREGAKSYLVGL